MTDSIAEIKVEQNPPVVFRDVNRVDGGNAISVRVRLTNISPMIDDPKPEVDPSENDKVRSIKVESDDAKQIEDILNGIQSISATDEHLTYQTKEFTSAASDSDRGPEFRAAQAISSSLSFDGTSQNLPNKVGQGKDDGHIFTGRILTVTAISNGLTDDAERVLLVGTGVHHEPYEIQASVSGKPLFKDGTPVMVPSTKARNEIVFFWKPKKEALEIITEYKLKALDERIQNSNYLRKVLNKKADRTHGKRGSPGTTEIQPPFSAGKVLG